MTLALRCARVAVAAAMIPAFLAAHATASVPLEDGTEGCIVFNPGLGHSCSYEATHDPDPDRISGIIGVGNWLVKVKRGGKTFRYESPPLGEPTTTFFSIRKGDRVRVWALTPGTFVAVGHDG